MLYLSMFMAGGLGVLARYFSVKGVNHFLGPSFPYGTLFVNVFGSLLFGFLSWYIVHRWSYVSNIEAAKVVVLTGFLGAFTTFSAFSMETLQLLQSGQTLKAGVYMLASVIVCVVACFVGVVLAKQIAY